MIFENSNEYKVSLSGKRAVRNVHGQQGGLSRDSLRSPLQSHRNPDLANTKQRTASRLKM